MSNVVSLPHNVLSVSPTTSSQPLCITEEGLIPWLESAGGLQLFFSKSTFHLLSTRDH